MSGSSRGSDGNGGPSIGNTCPTLFTGARLVSPKEPALTTVKTGDTLDLQVVQELGSFKLIASVNGVAAGSVSHTSVTQIIKCIQDGHTYVAHITKRDGGTVEFDIRMVNL